MSRRPDIQVSLAFNMKDPKASTIRTNAKREALEEILEAWCHAQVGAGPDPNPANQAEVYNITIGLWLADDSFGTDADTGNKGLTAGIVMDVLANHLEDVTVTGLGE